MRSEWKRTLCPTLDPDPRNHVLEQPPRPLNRSEGDGMITNGPCQVHLNPFWVTLLGNEKKLVKYEKKKKKILKINIRFI